METYLGIDFGGTKLLIGEVNKEGEILNKKQYNTGVLDQKEAAKLITDSLMDYVKSVGFIGTPVSAGIGIVGVVDYKNGIWKTFDYTNVGNIELAAMVEEVLKIKVFVDNDVKSATQAERRFGIGKQTDNFIYINIGTGLAAGIVSDGRIIRGMNNDAGEIGHMVLTKGTDEECVCGRKGCTELVLSGMGIDRQARKLSKDYISALVISKDKRVSAGEVFELAKKGDALCTHLVSMLTESLEFLIRNLIRVTDPEQIVLGGGTLKDGYLYEKFMERITDEPIKNFFGKVSLSTLSVESVGLIGAAANAMEGISQYENNRNGK